ncbi:MAG: TolC family protein [Omnitrophica bacterium]|nr:TolC family protein [Candidatus Omnitrophota bacterium]
MRKALYRTKILFSILVSSIFLFIFPATARFLPDQKELGKKGIVLTVNEEDNFIFVDLGGDKIKPGDLVEIYRKRRRIASATVKRTMRRMSEASITESAVRILIGDKVMVYEFEEPLPQKDAVSGVAAEFRAKVRKLEAEEYEVSVVNFEEREKVVANKFEALEEVKKLAEKSLAAENTRLKKSREGTIAALDKKLNILQEKKKKAALELGNRVSSLEHAKESIAQGDVPAETLTEETIQKLEKKLDRLEKTKKDTMANLKKEIAALQEKKVKIEPVPQPAIKHKEKKTKSWLYKAEGWLNKLEKIFKIPAVEHKLPAPLIHVSHDVADGEQLALDECIYIAIDNHLPLEIAKKQLKLAEFRLLEAWRKMGPSATIRWEASDGQVSGRYYDGSKISFEGKQPLFYGGEFITSVRQAKVNKEIVKTDHDRIKNEIILQVKKAYYTLDKAKKALSIQENLRDGAEKIYSVTEAGYNGEVISQVEFLEVSSQYNQTNFQVASAREDRAIAGLILQQAMNVDREIRIISLEEPKIIELNLEDCFDLASLNRPEIKISRLSMEHFELEKKITQARAFWPRIDLLGMYGNTREDFIKQDRAVGQNPRQLGPEYYVGTKISLPIFGSTLGYSFTKENWQPVVRTLQGTKSNTQELTFSVFDKLEDLSAVQEADLEFMRSQDDMNKKRQEIALEVKEVFFKYKKSLFLMDLAKSKLRFQAKQVEILKVRQELGELQYSDVIEEMIKLAEEEFSYIQAISDYFGSIAAINKAIGLHDYFKV